MNKFKQVDDKLIEELNIILKNFDDFEKFGSFVQKYVLNGKLDKIYNEKSDQGNIIPIGKVRN